jgi:two-component system, NarL family, nitrate/nitrite response regulator NarL
MEPVPAAVIDPDHLFRQGLRALLLDGGIRVEAEASTPQELERPGDAPRDVRLVLWQPSAWHRIAEDAERLRSVFPAARLIALAGRMAPRILLALIRAGMDGCLTKDISPGALVGSLHLVLLGEMVFPPRVVPHLLLHAFGKDQASTVQALGLSRRELHILRGLARGDTNRTIGSQLGIEETTVKLHVRNVLRKVSAANRTQAAIWAVNNGIS